MAEGRVGQLSSLFERGLLSAGLSIRQSLCVVAGAFISCGVVWAQSLSIWVFFFRTASSFRPCLRCSCRCHWHIPVPARNQETLSGSVSSHRGKRRLHCACF